jgi:L-asparaginase II
MSIAPNARFVASTAAGSGFDRCTELGVGITISMRGQSNRARGAMGTGLLQEILQKIVLRLTFDAIL